MAVKNKLGIPEYTEPVGVLTAEIFLEDDFYHLFIAGDTVRVFIGSSRHFQACKVEINNLQELVVSDWFKKLVPFPN